MKSHRECGDTCSNYCNKADCCGRQSETLCASANLLQCDIELLIFRKAGRFDVKES
jgi:hypothetical protein